MRNRFAQRQGQKRDWRMNMLRLSFIVFGVILIFRLFTIQVIDAGFYHALASGQHSFYTELFAKRGSVYVRDWVDKEEYIAATNTKTAFIFAEPSKIQNAEFVARQLSVIFEYEMPANSEKQDSIQEIFSGLEIVEENEELEEGTEESNAVEENPYEEYEILLERLSKENDPYEPIKRGVDENTLDRVLALEIEGINYVLEESRIYPEENIGGHIFGFLGQGDAGARIGQYGIEGHFNTFLSGVNGYLDSVLDPSGRWIGVGNRSFDPAVDGGDIVLTIDRTIQYKACEALSEGVERYQADSGTIIILEPKTGRVISMCNAPDFNPNTYNMVEDISVYNNDAVLHAYEPGSIFKPLIMAGAIDAGALSPTTLYEDTGVEEIDTFKIQNSDKEAHGWQTMTDVLAKSLNTGMIFAMRSMGMPSMREYIEAFGFGKVTGIELPSEVEGDISSLDIESDIFYATASYGQGITATPIQLAAAYAALANEGKLYTPYIVEEMRHQSGYVEKTVPEKVRQVIDPKTATTVGAMMVQVIEEGHGDLAAVPGYYLAGKTGTAQVVAEGTGRYDASHTKASFAGFGPVENPQFAMIVMLDHPKTSPWASGTAAPIWGEVADFILQYFEIAPTRIIE